jgi:hypothetical protein
MVLSRRISLLAVPVLAIVMLFGASGQVRAQNTSAPFTIRAASGSNVTANPGEEVTFTVTAPAPGTSYVWTFGDGSQPQTGTTVTHTYASVDDYSVTLAAQSAGGQTPIASQTLKVTPEFRGVFASDLDGQFTPADQFQMVVVVRAPGLSTIGVRTSGTVIAERSAQYDVTGGEDWLQLPDMQIADERDPTIQEQILKKPGGAIRLDGGVFTLALDYTTPSGKQETMSLTPPVRDFFHPDQTLSVTYPQISAAHGLPEADAATIDFYMHGDADFAHPDDYYVRLLALEFGRRGGAWPDDPQQVAMNIFNSINTLLGDSDPGEFNNDYNMARLWANGTLSLTRKNADYICISQAYLMTALGRTLGIPAREINNAIGEPKSQRADGVWEVRWWQEAGAELWYDNAWHYFDTYLAVTDRQAYLARNLIYQSWAAYNRQQTEFLTVRGEPTGLKGHNFSAWPGDPPQWTFLEEGVRPGIVVDGMISQPNEGPATFMPDGAILHGSPPAAGISSAPLAAPRLDIMAAPPATP